jgi:hypothetical protein
MHFAVQTGLKVEKPVLKYDIIDYHFPTNLKAPKIVTEDKS